jgi:hypothetical protein
MINYWLGDEGMSRCYGIERNEALNNQNLAARDCFPFGADLHKRHHSNASLGAYH